VIKEGLAPDERVIVEGMQRVRAEAEVKAAARQPPKAPIQALTQLLTAGQPLEGDRAARKPGNPGADKGNASQGTGN